ncbi:MAG: hypothetical protein OEV92_13720, partial [Nitrospinota bacterium]|nr:hypothetical protein [Nitrospinota bacterium]
FWQTRPARWVYWLFFLLLGTGLVIGHNFFLYAKEDYLVHQCFLDRRLAALDPSRIFYDFIRDTDLAAKAAAWALVTGALTALLARWKEKEISLTRFVFGAAAAIVMVIAGFYAAFPQKPQGFAEKQRDTFGAPKKGEWMFWSSTGGQVEAQIPAEFLPVVGYEELADGWVRLAPGVKIDDLMIFGKYLKLPPGYYRVELPVRVPGGLGDETGFIEVVDVRDGIIPAPGRVLPLKKGLMAEFTLGKPRMNVEPRIRFDSSVAVEIGPMKIRGAAL